MFLEQFLESQIFVGDRVYSAGPDGMTAASGLSASLKRLGIELMRFKTGTPARVHRRSVQLDCMREYISTLAPGCVIDAVITHMEPFGVFADIGAGISALMPIDSISVSRIPHPSAKCYQPL